MTLKNKYQKIESCRSGCEKDKKNIMELFTRKETAAIFGVKPMTIYQWNKKDILKPALFIRGRPRYTLVAIQQVATEKQL